MKPLRVARFASKLLTHRFTGVDLMLTRRCNLDCPYCGVINADSTPTLTTEQWLRIIAYFRRNRHVHFIFTGGEPLLHPGVADLIRDTSRHSLTCLTTNGKELTPEFLASVPELDFLSMSVDPDSSTADSGKHGFDNLGWLREHADRSGLSVSLMATVTRPNVEQLPDLVRRLKPYGFPLLLSLYHRGDASFNFRTDHAHLDFGTPDDIAVLDRVAHQLIELRREGGLIGETDWFLRSLAPFKRGERVTECRAGQDWFQIDCDGTIKACHDGARSGLKAQDEPDYRALASHLKATRPKNCSCIYNFYFNAQHLRDRPVRYLAHMLRTRNLITW